MKLRFSITPEGKLIWQNFIDKILYEVEGISLEKYGTSPEYELFGIVTETLPF